MVSIISLWLPIVLSAVFVFVVSSIIHMALAYHHSDVHQLPREAEALETLRRLGLTRGLYMFPHPGTHREMGSPEMVEKYRQGPVGMLTVMPTGAPKMAKFLGLWFGYTLLVGVFVAYIAGRTLSPGARYLAVFRVAGATAFMAYGLSQIVDSIWKGQTWGATIKNVFDGLVYTLVTAGTFGWLWP